MNIESKFKAGDVVIIDEKAVNKGCCPRVLIEIISDNYSFNMTDGWRIKLDGFYFSEKEFRLATPADVLVQMSFEKSLFESRQNHLESLIARMRSHN